MRMLVGGKWKDKANHIPVLNPFNQQPIDEVPRADATDVEEALATAVRGAAIMRKMPAYERYAKLRKAADLLDARAEEFGRTISLEEGKILAEGKFEATRAVQTLLVSAEEAKRITGEVLPLDAAPGGETKFGFTVRVPCGVVVAISPFNFPLNLVAHKIGPALAAGNSFILKPASNVPLSALKLCELLLEAGFPTEAVQCITGSGSEVGDGLCKDQRVRKITFTGSQEVGEHICKVAGVKRVTMELGSNSPLIVMDDADMDKVVKATVATGYSNAGQVCISTQRILADKKVYSNLLDALKPAVAAITMGDQMDEKVKMGPMIREQDAIRVEKWINEAVATGAKVVTGGKRHGSLYEPTVVADVAPNMRISREELFGPAVAVTKCDDVDEAIRLANDTIYGLSAAIFTQNIDRALRFVKEVDAGNLHVNWGPQWRADFMPYGGLKQSGLGKEGPKYAVQEMTEMKMVVIH